MGDHQGLDYLDAPWRMQYIEQNSQKDTSGCIFCDKPCETCDHDNYIVHRGELCFIIMNAYPYNSGHLMIIPYRHIACLNEMTAAEQLEMMQLATLLTTALTRIMYPDGFNLGMNLGRAGGAGIAQHLHMHIVPRWVGDTNFMTTVGNARVLPEAIEKTCERIQIALAAVLSEAHTEEQ